MKLETETVSEKQRLAALFEPRSIAVIGASRRKEAVGYAVFHNLVAGGFQGDIYPVNPKAERIDYVPCVPSVEEIPGPVDLAVIVVPAPCVPQVLEECGRKGVKAVIVISAGFGESGEDGVRLQSEAHAMAQKYGMPLLGPNCLGLINTDPAVSMNASFSRATPRPGKIAFISQSGALCAAVLDYAGTNVGFSKFVSLGNKADLTELNLIRYLKDDKQTEVILMYLEDLAEGHPFIQTVREITGDLSRTKPVLAIKSGRTRQGAKAAASHTGSLMGSDEVYDAIFAQAGVLRVDSIEEMFDLGVAFANEPLPKGNRVAIVTNAGGPGIMMTDACVRYGLELAELTSETREALRKVLPAAASVSNPVDILGDAQHDRYEKVLEIVQKDPSVENIIVLLTPQAMTDIEATAHAIVRFDQKTATPLVTCFMGVMDVTPGVKILQDNHTPHYTFPESAARVLGAMYRYRQWLERPRTPERRFDVNEETVSRVVQNARKKGRSILLIHECMEILEAYDFPVLPWKLAHSPEEAGRAAAEIGFPVVLKAVSEKVVHKFDVGGVFLGLTDEARVKDAAASLIRNVQAIPGATLDGILVQKMAGAGREVILGMKRDPHFGPVLMFGLGGIYVEALRDVTFRIAPIRELGAYRMMENIRSACLLKGVRGERPSDRGAVAESLERLSQLACKHPFIQEIDINPLLVYPEGEGVRVLDARMIIHAAEESSKPHCCGLHLD